MSNTTSEPLVQITPDAAKASRAKLDLSELRERLAGQTGPRLWRSLDEVAETQEFQEMLEREFPKAASEWHTPDERRQFLKLMGGSLALAGLTAGCTKQPKETIVPYAAKPEEIVPGKPVHFATSLVHGGYAEGVIVESHMYRPTKVEGNPEHPSSLGGASAFAQASVLGMYDPDRSQVVLNNGRISSWLSFLADLRVRMSAARAVGGAGLRILTETVTSPTLVAQIEALLAELPEAKWVRYEPVGRDNDRAGSEMAFGAIADAHYHFDVADVVLSLDADFLRNDLGSVRYSKDFAKRRRGVTEGTADTQSRLYAVEPAPSITGASADNRLRLKFREVEHFARALAAELGVAGVAAPAGLGEEAAKWVGAVATDLRQAAAKGLVVAGPLQPATVHALAHAINSGLGAIGSTVTLTAPVEASPGVRGEELSVLATEMEAGDVETLVMIGGNPVYDAPADLDFAAKLDKVPFRTHVSLFDDETSALCHWHVPGVHPFEIWSDARSLDGTTSIVQPLIEPLYAGKSAHEIVSAMAEGAPRSGEELLRTYWSERLGLSGAAFESAWRKILHDGLLPDTAEAPAEFTLSAGMAGALGDAPEAADGFELIFRPDASAWDGRFANNAWLQECPRPISLLTWDNVAGLSPHTAEDLGVENEDVLRITVGGRILEAPVWIVPGQADGVVALTLGYGRDRAGRIAEGSGYNPNVIRTADALWCATPDEVINSRKWRPLACVQDHHSMEGRGLVREASVETYQADNHFAEKYEHLEDPESLSMYTGFEYNGYAWGLAIDLNTCTGCNACVVACQSENNIPVVGKDQVGKGRELHWIRVDRYFEGELDEPRVLHQPVMCQQCENAPCEPVCPVGATVHSSEGLNDMVYNRCVGTRYCSNNCPYKVRRFNFLAYGNSQRLYGTKDIPSFELMNNPDVTVRVRGVMEKCTYCTQRISQARIDARRERRKVDDGAIVTACQQTCPADAISFGDTNDSSSTVSKWKADARNYTLISEINTLPRTSYLARVNNPNPALVPAHATEETNGH